MSSIDDLNFIHIGFQKSGTVFIHNEFYQIHPNVDIIQPHLFPNISRIMLDELVLPESFEYCASRFNAHFSDAVRDTCLSDDNGKVKGLIFEPLTFLYERRIDRKIVLQRICDLCPNVRIILTIRNQESWIKSHYSQFIRSGGRLSFSNFVEIQLNNPLLDLHYLNWYPLVAFLFEVFGRDRVLVIPYEQLVDSPKQYANEIATFLEIPCISINSIPVNRSLGILSFWVLRLLNFLFPFDCGRSNYSYLRDLRSAELSVSLRMSHRFAYSFFKPLLTMLANKLDRTFYARKQWSLTEKQERLINDRFREGNRRLETLLDVDLGQFGYPT